MTFRTAKLFARLVLRARAVRGRLRAMFRSFRKSLFPVLFAVASGLLAESRGADIRIVGKANPADKQTVSFSRLRSDDSPAAREFLATLRNDLLLSGWFVPVDAESASVQLSGSVTGSASGANAAFRALWAGGTRQRDWSRAASGDFVRDAAHEVADGMVSAIAGERPMASSKIAFVGRRGGKTDVYECDADGRRVRQITSGGHLCLSPNWEPRVHSFLYTSWASGLPAVWRVDLARNKQRKLCAYPGMNLGATASPADGRVAVVLSRSGQVDLYLVDGANGRILDRLTNSRDASESSPSWSPDGRSLVYVSDAGGVPRLYAMSPASKTPRRLVYASSIRENVAPEWGISGEIVFCGRSGGRYGVYVIDPSRDARTSTPAKISPDDGADYEDPSWAPDGRHVVCTRTQGRRRLLVVLDAKGDAPRKLFDLQGDWYLPSWSDNLRP